MMIPKAVVLTSILLTGWVGAGKAAEEIIGTLEDFSLGTPGAFAKGYLDHWQWSEAEREEFRSRSRLEVVKTDGDRHLRVEIGESLPFPRGWHRIVGFSPHFPPEADAIRVRLKVNSGVARIFFGGPTAYYANSDVFTAIQEIEAVDPPRWEEVTFSLNHPLWRNFRRAGFSTEARRIYYGRWAQEPTSLYVAEGTAGAFEIDRVELVATGEGRSFPAFEPDEVRWVESIADFEDGGLEDVFTLYMAEAESEWFEASWKREKPLRFSPSLCSIVEDGLVGRRSLSCVGPTAEEVHSTGLRTEGSSEANALRLTVKVEAPGRRDTLAGLGRAEPLDLLVFVAAGTESFPGPGFGPPDSWRASGHRGFDFQFTYRDIREREDADFAIYQARRFVVPGEWTTLVVPLADFCCVYGAGAFRQPFLEREPLPGEGIRAIAWLSPWSRVGDRQADVTIRLDALDYVAVPEGANADQLRSYWQIPDAQEVLLVPEGKGASATLQMRLPGETTDD